MRTDTQKMEERAPNKHVHIERAAFKRCWETERPHARATKEAGRDPCTLHRLVHIDPRSKNISANYKTVREILGEISTILDLAMFSQM